MPEPARPVSRPRPARRAAEPPPDPAVRAAAVRSAERLWWRRVPAVLVRPAGVFRALREEGEEDVEARQEPILAILLVAGMAGVVLTPAWGSALDDGGVDGLVLAVMTFVGGAFYGAAGYFTIGLVVHLGVRAMGSSAPFRLARHVLAFAFVPLALSLAVTLPVGLAAFGGDLFRSGGGDEGGAGLAWRLLGLAFLAWSAGLVAVGLRLTYRLAWRGVIGALLLSLVFVAAFAVLPSAL